MNLSEQNVKTLVLWFFIDHGKFPPETDNENWEAGTMSEMQWDDPPLPSDPNFEKRKLSQLLILQFNSMGLKLKSPLSMMKKKQKTMKDLWKFCFENIENMEVF